MWKQDPFCYTQETHLNIKNRYHLRINGWEEIIQENEPRKQAGVPILISDKVDFKLKLIRRDGRTNTTYSSKEKIYQEDISIISIYVPDTRVLCLKQICKWNTTIA